MAELAALIERLEALTGPDAETDWLITQWADPGAVRHSSAHQHYTRSLDAVIALVERELPGMAWTLGQNVHHRYWVASLNRLNDEGAPESIAWGQSNQPVIALLLALLRAKGGDNG